MTFSLQPSAARPLTQRGLDSALQAAGLQPDEADRIWAVIEVETAGVTQGFGFREDRLPQVLFERHKFRAFTNKAFDAVNPDLSGPSGSPYGSVQSQANRVRSAMQLCEAAGLGREPALAATSWGLGQVMGFNHTSAGFGTAEEMATAMLAGEDNQLGAMAQFLRSTGLAKKLQRQQWAEFAAEYNGAGYADFKYDVRLAAAYQAYSDGGPDLRTRAAQAALLILNYSPGKIDGVLGPRTRRELRSFQSRQQLAMTTELDDATYAALMRDAGWA